VAEEVRFPVYVLAKDCGEFTLFHSLEDMRGYMEAIDVENNEYDVWDAEGFMLRLIVTDSKKDWLSLRATDAQVSETRLNEITAQATPYKHSRANR